MPLGLVPAMQPIALTDKGKLAPPPNVRVAEGVRSAWLIGEGPFGRTPRRANRTTAAQRAGIRYEKAALKHLAGVLGRGFVPSQWFKFRLDGHALQYCQVDGLLIDSAGVVIFEVKTSFTADAWYQLRKLYEPVVREALRPARIGLVVVCKSFDPAVAFPEEVQHTELLAGWRESLTKIGVFQWRT